MPFLHPPFSGNYKRIISVVPSQTELLHFLGLETEVIAITKFCVHPEQWYQSKQRVGGTKNLRLEDIRKLQPDIIIANKEENSQKEIEALAKDFNVYLSDIFDLDSAIKMIQEVGILVNKKRKSEELSYKISQLFQGINKIGPPYKVAYLIWQNPYMVAGGDTFINDMLEKCGFENEFKNFTRYPEVSLNELKLLNFDYLLLSSEPYPFNETHIKEIQLKLEGIKCFLVDGEFFSWYGSRLLLAPNYFNDLIQNIKG